MLDDSGFAGSYPAPNLPEKERGPGSLATWGFGQLLAGVAAVLISIFLLSLLIILPVSAAFGEDSVETNAASAIMTVVWDISMVAIVLFIARRSGGNWENIGFRAPRSRVDGTTWSIAKLAGFVVLMYLASTTSVAVYNLIIDALGIDALKPSEQITEPFFEHALLTVLIGIAVVGAAPIAEEVFFRGFLFAGIRRKTPFIVAGLISGFVFSLAHADIGLVLPFTIVGFVLAYAYERSGSIIPAIGMHLVFNAISFFVLVFVPDAR